MPICIPFENILKFSLNSFILRSKSKFCILIVNTEYKKIALKKSIYYELSHKNGLDNKYLSNTVNFRFKEVFNFQIHLQGPPLGIDIMYLVLADRNMQVRFEGGLGILIRGHLTYYPLIWLKLTSLSSTASVLKECKISLKFQEFFQIFIFFKTSK